MARNQRDRDGWAVLFVRGCGGFQLSVMVCLFLVMVVMASLCSAVGNSEKSRETHSTSTTTTIASSMRTTTAETAGDPGEFSLRANSSEKPTAGDKGEVSLRLRANSSEKPTAGDKGEVSLRANSSEKPAFDDDFIMIEMIRLVFNGTIGTTGFSNKVYGLLESFLTRATREVKLKNGSDWSFELSSTLRPMEFENTTYMDFRLKHTARKEISAVFSQLRLGEFIAQNSHLVLVAECWTSRNCQNRSAEGISGLSVLEKNVSMVSTVAVLCSLCLVVMVTGMACSCLRRMKSFKKGNDETKTSGESQRVAANQSSQGNVLASSAVQAEGTFFRSCPFGEDEDEEGDIHSTWVIPIDKAPGRQGLMTVVTAQDTKL